MPTFDLVLLAIAGYVAVMSLVRLMRQRQRQVMRQMAEELRRQQASRPAAGPEAAEKSQGRAA